MASGVKDIVVGLTTAFAFGGMAWIASTLISVDKRTEVMAVKVEENYSMLKPLWEDFIRRTASNGYITGSNEQANLHPTERN